MLAGIDEPARRDVHTALAQLLGDEAAATFMELLPPLTWDQMEALRLAPWTHVRPCRAG